MAWEFATLLLIASLAATVVAVRRRSVRRDAWLPCGGQIQPRIGGGERYLCPVQPHVRAASALWRA